MTGTAVVRVTLGIVVALLTACGGTNTALNGAVPSGAAARSHKASESYGDLLYALGSKSGYSGTYVRVYAYPRGELVQQFPLHAYAVTLCSDAKGDVFFPALTKNKQQSKVVEYAHGGTKPIATLDDSPYKTVIGISCAINRLQGTSLLPILAGWL